MKLLSLVALCGLASAHFELKYPPSIGFSDDDEGKAPCGGFTPDFSKNVVDFHVDGEALAMRLSHQQCNWLFRATIDQSAASGWEQLFPIVSQTGAGDFCEPRVTAPGAFAGRRGVVSVVSSAADGLLYQCVAVNFVSGSANAPSECTNGSVQASFTQDTKLAALVGGSSSGGANATDGAAGGSSSATATRSGAAATSTGAAATLRTGSTAGAAWGSVATLLLLATAALGGASLL